MEMPYELIIKVLQEQSGLSEEELTSRVDKKQKELSGLVSPAGAAHIIANEMGIKLFDIPYKLSIADIKKGMRNVEIVGRVSKLFPLREFMKGNGKGYVGNLILQDETGTARVVSWNEKAKIMSQLNEGSIIRLREAQIRDNQGRAEIHLADRSTLEVNPEGVVIGESKEPSVVRKKIIGLDGESGRAEIFATIIQIFEPRFYYGCSECKSKVKEHNGDYVCSRDGKVEPLKLFVLNMILDDGTSTIRAVCYASQAPNIFDKDMNYFISLESTDNFKSFKNRFLGKQFILTGRVKKNTFFDRLEFIIDKKHSVDLDKEIKTAEQML